MKNKKTAAITAAIVLLICAMLSGCTAGATSCAASSKTLTSSSAASSSQASSSQVSSSKATSSFPKPEDDPVYAKAYANYAKRNYSAAIELCNEAINKDENCFWGYNLKGISYYFQNGNSVADKSLELINKSVEINPDYSYGYFNRALIEKGTKKWDKSIADFNKVLSYNDKDTWSYYGIATVYADTDNADKAIEYLKLAINLDPDGVRDQMKDDLSRHYSRLKSDTRFKALLNG